VHLHDAARGVLTKRRGRAEKDLFVLESGNLPKVLRFSMDINPAVQWNLLKWVVVNKNREVGPETVLCEVFAGV
jgi:hypothetical protein